MFEIENKLRLLELPKETSNINPLEITQLYLKADELIFSLIARTSTNSARLRIEHYTRNKMVDFNISDAELHDLQDLIPCGSFFINRELNRPGRNYCARLRVTTQNGVSQEELTLKGPTNNPAVVREVNVELPPGIYTDKLSDWKQPFVIEKSRFVLEDKKTGLSWDIDNYHGEFKGLITAENEIPTIDTPFLTPPASWKYIDVTGIRAYKNATLSRTGEIPTA